MDGGGEIIMNMAIVKATYTRSRGGAKASVKYIQHRPGKDGEKITRTLFGIDGAMDRIEAYRMIDTAENGSTFFRFVISPDAKTEDTERDLFLREITNQTMQSLENRVHAPLSYVAAIHDDHATHRHIHVLYASKMIMRPERETEEHLDPYPGQKDCQDAEGPLREPGPAPENAAAHPRAADQTFYGDDYASRPVARHARAIQCGWHQDHRQASTPRISAPVIR
jgi:hypothetical protein